MKNRRHDQKARYLDSAADTKKGASGVVIFDRCIKFVLELPFADEIVFCDGHNAHVYFAYFAECADIYLHAGLRDAASSDALMLIGDFVFGRIKLWCVCV